MVKQYITKPAYTGNTTVVLYENCKEINSRIVSDYSLYGYLERLEEEGYERAYDEAYYLAKFKETEEAYYQAKEDLERARAHPLYKI